MSHRNMCVLTGTLLVTQAGIVNKGGVDLLEVIGTVDTGPVHMGGRHRILLYGKNARAVSAFVEANEGDGMEVTVSGGLYSGENGSQVYVDRISFHVRESVVEKAMNTLRGAEPRSRRGTGPLKQPV
ncbi:MAG: hypothetical protein ACERKX_12105 [Anaerolineales bacterium]